MLKRLGWSVLAVFILLFSVTGYLYYSIKSAKLADIVERQTGENIGNVSVPPVLGGTINKASKLAGKPVEAQDALDAASILLNSGLSLREITYLTGEADTKMSVEEKQKIRDLLLEKLEPEEITALRSITTKYGKGLVILDPDYPIELVGVYDPEEREKIQKELAEKDQDPAEQDIGTPEQEQFEGELPVTETSEDKKRKSAIIAKYQDQLTALHSSCMANVDRFTGEIIQEIAQAKQENKPLSPDVIDKSLQNQIVKAETACDQSFQAIVDKAEQELTGENLNGQKELAAWKQQYNSKKTEARTNAFNRITKQS